ncbi:hypothetical protein FM107_18900 [Sphingobacterium sp. JB170]|nr:hypothetical protein FM107_18900 [Sphingobacterium sp. JB170]
MQSIKVKSLEENTYGTGNLDLTPLISFLQKILLKNGEKLKRLPQSVLELIQETEEAFSSLNQDNLASYKEVFEMIYLFENGLRVEEKGIWALGYPVPQEVFYGTEDFYGLFDYNTQLVPKTKNKNVTPIKQLLYSVILERFYGVPNRNKILTYTVTKDQVTYFYELSIDFTFVDITRVSELPIINLASLRDKEEYSPEDLEPIFEVLDPKKFEFTGFTLLKFQDKTQAYNAERLRTLTTELSDTDPEIFFDKLHKALSDITQNSKITCSLLPLGKLNGYPIASTGCDINSIFFREIQKKLKTGDLDQDITAYLENPFPIISGVETSLDTEHPVFRKIIERKRLASYICIPLRHRKDLVGFLELYSIIPDLLGKKSLLMWHEYLPLLTHLTAEILAVFKTELERVILDNFTALNPAVQWRFNEVAANHLTPAWLRPPRLSGRLSSKRSTPSTVPLT